MGRTDSGKYSRNSGQSLGIHDSVIIFGIRLTLAECSQNYEVIKKERRREVFDILEKHMNVGFYSFTSHLGYSTCYSASDFARAMSLRLEYKAPKQASP